MKKTNYEFFLAAILLISGFAIGANFTHKAIIAGKPSSANESTKNSKMKTFYYKEIQKSSKVVAI